VDHKKRRERKRERERDLADKLNGQRDRQMGFDKSCLKRIFMIKILFKKKERKMMMKETRRDG
jgi:hypothetical protein